MPVSPVNLQMEACASVHVCGGLGSRGLGEVHFPPVPQAIWREQKINKKSNVNMTPVLGRREAGPPGGRGSWGHRTRRRGACTTHTAFPFGF